jgi:hypothetical protein
MNVAEKADFLMRRFKESILTTDSDSSDRLAYCFQLGIPPQHQNRILVKQFDVCRNGWRLVYGFSLYELDQCSKIYKEIPDAQGSHLQHKKFDDRTIHPYTYSEAASIFYTNLPEYGNRRIIFLF